MTDFEQTAISREGFENQEPTATFSLKRAVKCIAFHSVVALCAYETATWDAVLMMLGILSTTICVGFTVGMHRGVIHRAF